jgi:transposase
MSVVMLSPQEKAALEQVAADAVLQPAARRAQALLWLACGQSIPDVAKSLVVSRQTVYNWLKSFQLRRRDADIVASLNDKPRSGRPTRRPRMSTLPAPEALDQIISSIIDRDPRECGYRSILWTTMLLRQYLREVYSVKVTIANVRSALTRLETRWQPVTVLAGEQYSHNEVA